MHHKKKEKKKKKKKERKLPDRVVAPDGDKERREDGLISELRVAEAKASSKITNKKKKKKKM